MSLNPHRSPGGAAAGFTLVETLVAITLICIAIVAPMALTVQSLHASLFARDQITASNLAQEGVEAVRAVRDGNILLNAEGTATPLFNGIPTTDSSDPNYAPYGFYVDATQVTTSQIITSVSGATTCSSSGCVPLRSDGTLYNYSTVSPFKPTKFTRTVTVDKVRTDANGTEEIRVTSKVSWQATIYQIQSVSISEDLYNWPQQGSAHS